MNIVLLNELIEDNNEPSKNEVIEEVKKNIEFTNDKYTSLLYDYSETKFGIPVNGIINYNDKISTLVTNLFKNTKIHVYIFTSKKALLIGIPGANKNVTPELLRQEAARDAQMNQVNTAMIASAAINKDIYIPVTNSISSSIFETTANAIKNANKEGGETKLLFDPITKKLDINVDEITVYISTNYLRCMQTDDELIASILFEISKNTVLYRKILENKFINIGLVASLITIVPLISGLTYVSSKNPFYTIFSGYISLGVLLVFALSISIYLAKRRNLEYDEFVVKCGYGNALRRAIKNYYNFVLNNTISNNEAIQSLNVLDKISHFFIKIGTYIKNAFSWLGLTSKQSIGRRLDTIKEKTNIYDISDRNINRSNRINY